MYEKKYRFNGSFMEIRFQLNARKDFQIIPYPKNENDDKLGLNSYPDKAGFQRRFLLRVEDSVT